MSGWWAFPASGPSSSWRRSSTRRISRRSFRSIRAAPMARPAASATSIPAASSICFGFCCRSMPRRISRKDSRSHSRPKGRSYGRRRSPQHFPAYFDILIDPYDKEAAVEKSEAEFSKITVPTYTGSGWYGYTYKTHLNGAQNWFRNLTAPHKKLLLAGPAHLDRPIKAFHNEMLRWYDQWLKGIDTGILNDPPVRFWVMGANEWRSASDWPPPETQWIKFYLRGWERLTTEPFTPSSADDYQAPDAFAQMPASQTNRIQRLRYLSEPLPDDVTIAGPSVLHLYASIDQDDTN